MYSEKDLNELIYQSIDDCDTLPSVCKFASTESGRERIFTRVKEHILVRGIDNVDSALALVDQELQEAYIEPNY